MLGSLSSIKRILDGNDSVDKISEKLYFENQNYLTAHDLRMHSFCSIRTIDTSFLCYNSLPNIIGEFSKYFFDIIYCIEDGYTGRYPAASLSNEECIYLNTHYNIDDYANKKVLVINKFRIILLPPEVDINYSLFRFSAFSNIEKKESLFTTIIVGKRYYKNIDKNRINLAFALADDMIIDYFYKINQPINKIFGNEFIIVEDSVATQNRLLVINYYLTIYLCIQSIINLSLFPHYDNLYEFINEDDDINGSVCLSSESKSILWEFARSIAPSPEIYPISDTGLYGTVEDYIKLSNSIYSKLHFEKS